MVNSDLDMPTDVAAEIGRRSLMDAAAWFADWLRSRDELNAEIATEQVAEALEALAVELRREARHATTTQTRGLILAATVLLDTAGGIRVGDPVPLKHPPYTQAVA